MFLLRRHACSKKTSVYLSARIGLYLVLLVTQGIIGNSLVKLINNGKRLKKETWLSSKITSLKPVI